jgi:hypothetical protein
MSEAVEQALRAVKSSDACVISSLAGLRSVWKMLSP